MLYRRFNWKCKRCDAYTLCSFFFWGEGGGWLVIIAFLMDQTLLDGNLGIDD